MVMNLRGKNHTIQYKVYTSEAIDDVLDLIDKWHGEMVNELGGEVTECLYEIRIGKNLYSGLDKSEFRSEFRKATFADYVRIVLKKEPSSHLDTNSHDQVNNVQATIILDRNGDSYFSVVGDNNKWVDSVFNQFLEHYDRVINRNQVMNSRWLEMGVQVAFASVLTIASIFAANQAGQYVDFPYTEIYVFVITFVFLSNIWGFIFQELKSLRTRLYPVVDIRAQTRQRYSLAVSAFLLLGILGWAIEYLLNLIFLPG